MQRLTWRLFRVIGSAVLASLLVTLVLLSTAASRASRAAIGEGLDRTSRIVTGMLEGRAGSLASGAQVFALNPVFRSLVLDGKPGDLLDQAIEAADRIGASWVQIASATGVRLAKSDDPTAPAAQLAGSALISEALGGSTAIGFGSSADSVLFQAVAVPIGVDSGRVSGVLMAALMIDSVLAGAVQRASASEVVFYSLDTSSVAHITASTLASEGSASLEEHLRRTRDAAALEDSTAQVTVALGGDTYVGRRMPLRSAGGELLGGVLALRSRSAELAPFARLRQWIVLTGIVGLALAFALSLFTARSIARPVLALERATRRIAAGDYGVDVDVRSNDEIGALADAVRTMVADLRAKETLVDVLREATVVRKEQLAVERGARGTTDGAFAPGQVVAGRYLIRGTLGTGGSGVVYSAVDNELDEPVALKVLQADARSADTTAVERLKSEIRLARRISHRNVVRTHDLGEIDGTYFITMELVAGTSLRELIDAERSLPVAATFAIGKQLCRGLEVAHGEGIIHRDIKPENLMLCPDGTLKIMDFGVARLVTRSQQLTQAGLVVGTPDYMAPEQLLDDPIDARCDLYSAGMVLYECITGVRPFQADSTAAIIGLKLSGRVRPPLEINPAVPPSLSALLVRTLAKDAGERPSSAAELHDLLVASEG